MSLLLLVFWPTFIYVARYFPTIRNDATAINLSFASITKLCPSVGDDPVSARVDCSVHTITNINIIIVIYLMGCPVVP